MKKNYVYALMSAVALVGAVSLSACSSSDDVVDVNPTFDGEAVKTQFTISLPQNISKTRQTYEIVQEGQQIDDFRGMTDIKLIPFSNAAKTARDSRLGANIVLGAGKMSIPTGASNLENAIPSGKLLDNNNAVLYNDVTIPVGTAGFLFYGKAPETDDKEFEEGRLTAAGLDGQTSGISFTPTPILTTAPVLTKGVELANFVSKIAAASYDNNTPTDATDDIAVWAGCADVTNVDESWYNVGLGELYTAFTSMKAGASSYVLAAVQDLYASIYLNQDIVSLAIKDAIENTTFINDTEKKYVSSASSGTLTFNDDIKGYPANINMPEGSAALSWDPTASPKVASAVGGSNFGHVGATTETTMNVVNMSNIVYPASLYYYVNSAIQTSNESQMAKYVDTNDWTAILTNYTGSSVSSATRSVAITSPIQYAVGRLDVTVKKLEESKYYDRNGEEVQIPAEGYELTGVLIGGQKAVDYNFEQILSTNTLYTGNEYTIYDKKINTEDGDDNSETNLSSSVTTSDAAGPTYTMALETAAEEKIYVALEFVNNGSDFQGFDGVVKSGCKFYMIAQLDPTTDVDNKVSGSANTGKKVFKQDFKTIANFKFGAGSTDTAKPGGLANAYTTIPDLRTPKLELGLSVDLEWQDGITFTVEF